MFSKKRCIFLCICAFVLLSCHGSKKIKRLHGTWQESTVVVDGSNKDWPSPYPEYDENAALGYCISNDKYNLYISVETGDLATQLKILENGLTVWIDKTGNKQEITAINFPIPKSYVNKEKHQSTDSKSKDQQSISDDRYNQKNERFELEDKVRSELKEVKEYSLQGFKACNFQFPLLENDTCVIKARIAIDSENELVWEAVIPFKAFYYKTEVSKTDKGKPISVCFETTASKRPKDQPVATGNHSRGTGFGFRPSIGIGGFGGMGLGMSPAGGMHNRQNTTGSNNLEMESLYKSTKTYKVFGIAWYEQK